MLKDQNLICLSSIDWDFVWQGHQEIMSNLAKNGNKVLFIENTGIRPPRFKDIRRLKKRIINWIRSIRGFRMEMENLYIYSPLILPFPYSKIARWFNRRIFIRPIKNWMKIMEFHNPIIWTFLPTGTALDIIDNIDHKLLVYYCIADFYELVGNYKKVKRTEDELIRRADLIFAQGKALQEKCSQLNKNVYIFPFGVSMATFEDFRKSCSTDIPVDIKEIKKPIIGYIGGIHKHIDFDLLKTIAEKHPEWSLVLVGPLQVDTNKLNNLKNVFLLGKKDFNKLPYYINKFDVCIVPYLKTKYTSTVYPTKLNEYHALGKRVVSTDLAEVINFNSEFGNLILIAKTPDEFMDCISLALKERDGSLTDKRISSACRNDWTQRIEEMSSLIDMAVNDKSKTSLNWREDFLRLYRLARRRTIKLTFIILAAYSLLFYTPLVWFLASPLRFRQVPVKADCILVFAGGVGESGRAGQGYQERVKSAVELYKQGFANNIIFSSGDMHIFKEPQVMKALAISLGIPEDAIILEDQARSTYQNVKFSNDILLSRGWNRILLVSSPYHMKRTSLVFNKVNSAIKVTYIPMTNSSFYAHPERDVYGKRIWKRINLVQIKGLLHEYLGIVYYWLRGWV